MQDESTLRWIIAAAFVCLGAVMVTMRDGFGDVCTLIPRVAGDANGQERLHQALLRRKEREDIPQILGLIVVVWSYSPVVLAIRTNAWLILLYAGFTVIVALELAFGYLRLSRAAGRRVASLRARGPSAFVPSYLYALTAVAVVTPLTFINESPILSVVVTSAALTIALIGRSIATMPALLTGEDVAVEQFVDDRLRAVRTVTLLGIAAVPAVVMAAFSGFFDSALHAAAFLVSLLTVVVAVWLQRGLACRAPSAADVAAWS